MATLRIWETVRASHLNVLRLDERTTYQGVDFTSGEAQSAAFDADTSVITITTDAACAIAVGPDPTADSDGFPLAANAFLDLEVQPGHKISAVAT